MRSKALGACFCAVPYNLQNESLCRRFFYPPFFAFHTMTAQMFAPVPTPLFTQLHINPDGSFLHFLAHLHYYSSFDTLRSERSHLPGTIDSQLEPHNSWPEASHAIQPPQYLHTFTHRPHSPITKRPSNTADSMIPLTLPDEVDVPHLSICMLSLYIACYVQG